MTNNDTTSQVYWGGMSIFNIRQYDYGDESMNDFLQKNKNSLGIPADIDYIPGNGQVYESFHKDITKSYASDIVVLLKSMKVLLYNGQDDFVCNTAGVLQYVNSLNWVGIDGWKRTKKQVWTIDGEVKGWAKVSGNLWFALVNGAGHLVPTDQPKSAFSLLGHFLNNDKDWKQ